MGPNFFRPRKCFAIYFGKLFTVKNVGRGKSTVYKEFFGKPDSGVDRKKQREAKRATNARYALCKLTFDEIDSTLFAPQKCLKSFSTAFSPKRLYATGNRRFTNRSWINPIPGLTKSAAGGKNGHKPVVRPLQINVWRNGPEPVCAPAIFGKLSSQSFSPFRT